MTDSLLVGLSALKVHNRAMQVTSHNIANAATPGYTRQTMSAGTEVPQETRPGSVGRGVTVQSIQRNADALMIERLRESYTEVGRLTTLSRTLEDIELVYNEPGEGGLSNVVNSLFATLEDLSNNPESPALRTGAVQQFETFSSSMRLLSDRLQTLDEQLIVAADAEIAEINILTEQIAGLNSQVARQVLAQQNPNDLLDQRDRLLNELSSHLAIRTFNNPTDGTVRVELSGRTLISSSNALVLDRGSDSQGNIALIFAETGATAVAGGGSFGAIEEIDQEIIPEALDSLNELAGTIIAEFNAVHAVGISNTYSMNSHTSERAIDANLLDVNIDDPLHAVTVGTEFGIPESLAPSYSDRFGNPVARNLTINLLNEETGVAEKFTLRYEPGTSTPPASRSMEDIVQAINTGRGGGYTVYPPRSGGIDHVSARAVSVSDGIRLQMVADDGYSIDFSQALDTRPADGVWTGDTISATAVTDPAMANQRILFEVQNGGTELIAYNLDPDTGDRIPFPGPTFSVVDLTAASPAQVPALPDPAQINLSFVSGGTYTDGQSFALDYDENGDATATAVAQYTEGNAGFTIKGRYTGSHSFDPAQPWSMTVLQDGVIGAPNTNVPPNNPPVVEFTYYTGPADARVQQSVQFTLDENIKSGDQVLIGEGVYAIFDAGLLTAGDSIDFTVDSDPDQARLLPALGINTLFNGIDAETISVADRLQDNSNLLGVAVTRSAGDNTNTLALIDTRFNQVFGDENTSLEAFYQAQVSDVAVRVRQTESLADNQSLLQASLQNRRDEISGVSVDEEVSLLILQQQAYTAAARVISIARENIQTLMGILQ